MSEHRIPNVILKVSLPENQGKKYTKIELFSAWKWAHLWSPSNSKDFYPRPPLKTFDRQKYWGERYRVRIDGRWAKSFTCESGMTVCKYVMFSRDEIFEQFVNF